MIKKNKPKMIVKEELQNSLFVTGEAWEEAWGGMPEFVQPSVEPFATVNVHFATREDMEAFAKLVGQRVNLTTPSIWYPESDQLSTTTQRYASSDKKQVEENPFIVAAEACQITKKQWTNLLNVGIQSDLSLEKINDLIAKKFNCKLSKLKSGDFDEAVFLLKNVKQ